MKFEQAWLTSGTGWGPRSDWAFAVEGPLAGLGWAGESEDAIVADSAGGLALLDPDGAVLQTSRGWGGVTAAVISADGSAVAIASSEGKVAWLARDLTPRWRLQLHTEVTAIALDPFGEHLAVALIDGGARIYSAKRRRLAEFEAIRPLRFLRFPASQPMLVGASNDGFLSARRLNGTLLWENQLWAACGDMACSDDGDAILVAAFSHGVQRFDGDGTNRGTDVVEGTPSRLAVNYDGTSAVVVTQERRLYRLGAGGRLLWTAEAPDDVTALAMDNFGRRALVGLATGRVVQLAWDESP